MTQDERIQALEAQLAEAHTSIGSALDSNDATRVLKQRISEQNDEIASLRQGIENLSKIVVMYCDYMHEDRDRREAAESQLTALRQQLEALRPYLQHTGECKLWSVFDPDMDMDCTCGLDALLIALSAHVG